MLGLRVITKITFTQRTPYRSAAGVTTPRSSTVVFDFVNSYEITSTWNSLTDDGSITLPKNVYVADQAGNRYPISGTNINIGGFTGMPPLFLRGDAFVLERGYIYYDERGNEITQVDRIISGYISEVGSKKPIVLKVEDNMYLLKKTPAVGANGRLHFPGKQYTVEKMIKEMLVSANLNFTVKAITETNIGDFWVNNETIAQVLARLQKDYHFTAYFNDTELRIGTMPYVPQDAIDAGKQVFAFQKNIIEDSLQFSRKDDITLSAVVHSVVDEVTGKTTKDGHKKTKKNKLEALITFENGSDTPKITVGTKEKPLPANTGGERYEFYFYGVTDIDELVKRGINKLRLFYYTGFRGKFTTFGLPHIKPGTYVDILDPVLPERNGRYIVKSVTYGGGIDGNTQQIEVHYMIGRLDAAGNFIGMS